MDPLRWVRESAERVMGRARGVRLADDADFDRAAERLCADSPAIVAWDESGWHFCADAADDGPLTCQYIMVLDALNFCFWPSETGVEYEHLARGLKGVLERDPHAFDADRLAAVTAEELAGWVEAPHRLPNMDERVAKLREVGAVLAASFEGRAIELVRRARGSAVELVRLIVANFPGFRDEAVYEGRQVAFYKRAQILVADLWGAYGRKTEGGSPFAFRDVEALTMFADYRVPQSLRALDLLTLEPALAARVAAGEVLPAGGAEEVEIRAATIVAVERLREALARRGRRWLSVELDWWLWQTGEADKDRIPPFHRCLTCFY